MFTMMLLQESNETNERNRWTIWEMVSVCVKDTHKLSLINKNK